MRRSNRGAMLLMAILLAGEGGLVRGASDPQDRKVLEGAFRRLVHVVDPKTVPAKMSWPPAIEYHDRLGQDTHNAYASVQRDEKGDVVRDAAGKLRVRVVMLGGMMEDLAGDADCLALVLAHEVAHLVKGHPLDSSPGQTQFVRNAYTRVQEDEADRLGAEIALQAGYSVRKGIAGWRRISHGYSTFEGLRYDHPATLDRVATLDQERAPLWRAMSAFQNGVEFVEMEQYAPAVDCFAAVTREFPASYEAWANLGYAKLMLYCDALEVSDVRAFAVGQIVCGAFYRRPASLEPPTRGINESLWGEAVAALRKAVELQPSLALPPANLGVAFLTCPAGVDAKKASQHFQESLRLAQKDPQLTPAARVALLVNAAVAYIADGQTDLAKRTLVEVDQALTSSRADGVPRGVQRTIAQATLYNRATMLASSRETSLRRQALDQFEDYLRRAHSASVWQTLARERYRNLCQELKVSPKTPGQLEPRTPAPLRQLAALQLRGGKTVALTEAIEQVQQRLGEGDESPVGPGAKLVRLTYPEYGVELIAADRVIAIHLCGADAPPILLRRSGLAAGGAELRIGLSKEEVDRILPDQDYDFRRFIDSKVDYRCYADLGLALRIQGGTVAEILVAQIPRQPIVHE